MAYPEHFLRGIINEQFLVSGLPAGNLFPFQYKQPPRIDNRKECSVTWKDNNRSIQVLLREMTEKDEPRYKEGIGVFSTLELNRIKKKSHCRNILMYERNEIPGNVYHGNLLLEGTVDKKLTNEIASLIALSCFVEIIPITAKIEKDGIKFYLRKFLIIPFSKVIRWIKTD